MILQFRAQLLCDVLTILSGYPISHIKVAEEKFETGGQARRSYFFWSEAHSQQHGTFRISSEEWPTS